ncbi:MAG TPA: SMC family ATPase [Nocardioidaceae bacterium]
MRLHHLSLTAFGPFAGSEEVDFDELCDAGLFLLTGPTGAGKSTILDAVCFALYGSVPGVRGVKALKSQHAADDVRPEVVLDFSVRDRRFVVRRSPEWSRPKRRGSGVTTQNATATLLEVTTGEEHLLSSRAQEVGHFIGDLVGMQATQFMQVALLPQGEFQRFLRATSQDRHAVLQHLFRTDRYARIEEWVQDHSRGLRDRSAAQQQAVVRVLDTVADRARCDIPDGLVDDGLESPEAEARASSWLDRLCAEAETGCGAARAQHATATEAVDRARAEHDEALRLQGLHDRRDEALTTLAALAADDEEAEESRSRLDGDERAARCLPLLRLLDESAARRDEAARAWRVSEAQLEGLDTGDLPLPDPVTPASLAAAEQEARSRASRLQALLPRERALTQARADLARDVQQLSAVADELEAAVERSTALPARIAEQRTRLATAAAAAARTESLALQLRQAEDRLTAARGAEQCAELLARLREAERDARDRAADARERMQDLTARRLAGFAAELAGRLRDGEACQVCGSTQHPSPATAAHDQVTEAEQDGAAAAYDAAASAHADATGQVLQAEQRLDGLRAAAGDRDPAAAAAHVEDLAGQLGSARAAQVELAEAESAVDLLTQEQEATTATVHDLEVRRATLTHAVETHRAAIDGLTAELAAEVDVDVPLGQQVSWTTGLADSLAGARESLCARDDATARAEELRQHADDSARDNGFDGLSAVRSAVLPAGERRRIEELLRSRADARARATATLEDDAVRAVEGRPRPDLSALAATLAEAENSQRELAPALHRAEEARAALHRLRARLDEAFAAWAPAREEYLRAESMAKLVRGMSAENQLQMRLSAYVLATRLDQVVDAANERLAHMRDQRYLLQRTGRVARKGAQAGLGLEVVDQWTGDARDPATLSGGETFVVSLALALGLADVVTHEAGGTEIETLFVDEGFGTLDADTLDDVMDRLDDLRAGGRAVGVVSHVSEMRNRIPTQLHVDKRRNGSVVSVRTAVG